MKKTKTQREKIEAYLRKHGAIDNFYSIKNMLSLRLAAVIRELKVAGWTFNEKKSGFIEGTKNYQYVLKKALKAKK